MEVTDNAENVAPPAEEVPVKQNEEEPKEAEAAVDKSAGEPTDETNKHAAKDTSTEEKQGVKTPKPKRKRSELPESGSGEASEGRTPRVRKQVQRWSDELSSSFKEKEMAKEKAIEEVLGKGSGTALGDIPIIESSIRKAKLSDLKLLYSACFGRAGTAGDIRPNLRKFNGLPFDAKSEEYTKREAALNKKPVKEIQEALRQLHLEVTGTRSQVVARLLEFLLKPDGSGVKYKGKLPPSKRGRKSKSSSSSEKEKKKPKPGRKSKKTSKESEEEEGESSSEGEENEDEEEQEQEQEASESPSEKEESDGDDEDFSASGSNKKKKAGKKGGRASTSSSSRKRKSAGKKAPPAKRRKRTKKAETESESEHEEDELSDLEEESGEGSKKSKEEEEETSKSKKPESEKVEKKDKTSSEEKVEEKESKIEKSEGGGNGEISSAKKSSDEHKNEAVEEEEEAKPSESGQSSSTSLPSETELKEKTLELLRSSNLNDVSMRTIRESLNQMYPNVNLSPKKEFINGVIKEFLGTSS